MEKENQEVQSRMSTIANSAGRSTAEGRELIPQAAEREAESLAVAHARKQGAADGFQTGWHAALARVSEGDRLHDLRELVPSPARPTIICLCGSTRFIETFAIKTWELELKGYIVLGCTLLPSWYCPVREHFAEAQGVKPQRDAHHLQKIDLADEVLVLNVGGYIGESTRNEIAYAIEHGKVVRYVEPATERPSLGSDRVDVTPSAPPAVVNADNLSSSAHPSDIARQRARDYSSILSCPSCLSFSADLASLKAELQNKTNREVDTRMLKPEMSAVQPTAERNEPTPHDAERAERYRYERPAMQIVEAIKRDIMPTMHSDDGGEILGWILDLTVAVRNDRSDVRDAQYEAKREGFNTCREALRASFHAAIALIRSIHPDAKPPRFSLGEVEEALDALRTPSEWERTTEADYAVDPVEGANLFPSTRDEESSCSSCLSLRAELVALKAQQRKAVDELALFGDGWFVEGAQYLADAILNIRLEYEGRQRQVDDLSQELVALKAERAKAIEELKCFMGGWLEGGCQSVSEAIHAVRCNHEQALAQLQRLVGDKLSPASAERAKETNCPECGSPDRDLHPLIDAERELTKLCRHAFHNPIAPAIDVPSWEINGAVWMAERLGWQRHGPQSLSAFMLSLKAHVPLPPPPASSERETKA